MLCTKFQQFQALFDVKTLASCLIASVLAIEFNNLNIYKLCYSFQFELIILIFLTDDHLP